MAIFHLMWAKQRTTYTTQDSIEMYTVSIHDSELTPANIDDT